MVCSNNFELLHFVWSKYLYFESAKQELNIGICMSLNFGIYSKKQISSIDLVFNALTVKQIYSMYLKRTRI